MASIVDQRFVYDLKQVLLRLSAPATQQIEYLRNLGTAPSADELALELADMIDLVPQQVQDENLTEYQASTVYAVDQKLLEMSGTEDLWTESALHNSQQWSEIRTLATASLHSFPE